MVALRRDHPVFRRRRFFKGDAHHGGISDVGEIAWFTPSGTPMEPADWTNGFARAVAVFLNGEALFAPDKRGQRVLDDSFLLVFNAHHEGIEFTVPPIEYGVWWTVLLDTADDAGGSSDTGDTYAPGHQVAIAPRSLVVLLPALAPAGCDRRDGRGHRRSSRLRRPLGPSDQVCPSNANSRPGLACRPRRRPGGATIRRRRPDGSAVDRGQAPAAAGTHGDIPGAGAARVRLR